MGVFAIRHNQTIWQTQTILGRDDVPRRGEQLAMHSDVRRVARRDGQEDRQIRADGHHSNDAHL